MLDNEGKKKIHNYIEIIFPDLYKEVVGELFADNLKEFLNEYETNFNRAFGEELIYSQIDKIYGSCGPVIANHFSISHDDQKLNDVIYNRFSVCCKQKIDMLEPIFREYTNREFSAIMQDCIKKYSSLDIYTYDSIVKMNCAVLKIVMYLFEAKSDKKYFELLNNSQHESLVKLIIEDNKFFICNMLKEGFSDFDYIKTGYEEVKKRIENFVSTKLEVFFREEFKSILNPDELTKEIISKIEDDISNSNSEQTVQGDLDLDEKHITINNGDKGITYEKIFGSYLKGAHNITLIEPYLNGYYQYENLLQFCKLVIKIGSIRKLHIITKNDSTNKTFPVKEKFLELTRSFQDHNIELTYKFSQAVHDREINCDNGWIIKIGRGLHIYQTPKDDELSKYDSYFRPCHLTKVDIYREKSISHKYNNARSLSPKENIQLPESSRRIVAGL